MKMTVLEMTQTVLSSLSSDEVNSISDTSESMQVATILQTCYFNMVSRAGLPEQKQLIQLTASADPTLPIIMTKPDNVSKIEWIKYFNTNPSTDDPSGGHDINTDITSINWSTTSTTSNTIGLGSKTFTVANSGLPIAVNNVINITSGTNVMVATVLSYAGTTLIVNVTSTVGSGTFTAWVITPESGIQIPGYQYVTILGFTQFMDMINGFNPADTDVRSYEFVDGPSTYLLYYKNDRQPSYCTALENNIILFDTYDATQDTTLQSAKIMCFGEIVPVFTMSDNFIPDMEDYKFPLLINEAKSLAYFELKQAMHPKAEQEVKRQWSNVSKTKSLTDKPSYFDQLPNFGRRPGTGGYALTVRSY